MPYPINPANNTLYTDADGIIYIYNAVEKYWKRNNSVITSAYVTNQVTKLGVTGASVGAPRIVALTIPTTTDFNRAKLEVLKLAPAANNIVVTECDFNNGDSTSFNADPLGQTIFDGTMHLKTSYTAAMTYNGALGSGNLWSQVIDKSLYKTVEKIQLT